MQEMTSSVRPLMGEMDGESDLRLPRDVSGMNSQRFLIALIARIIARR